MIANEEEKRSHLRSIIEKLKSQKSEHSSVIDILISENDQLSREVLRSEREVRINLFASPYVESLSAFILPG